jgi:calcineurin-like phosphoesterase family protein
MIYVIGCCHFDDDSIIGHRRFRSTEEMNLLMAENWKRVVSDDDVVYVLGDFSLKRPSYWQERLPGKKILIIGNHDTFQTINAGFAEVRDSVLLRERDGRNVITCWLSHYPYLSWPERGDGCVHLHAHCHGNSTHSLRGFPGPWRLDMSAEIWNYTPVNLLQAVEAAKTRMSGGY